MNPIDVEIPALVGSDEEIALGEHERWRCRGLIFCRGIERPYNSSWQEYVALVRRRAHRALETEVQALYWVERRWRWDVFGHVPRHPFETARWEPGAAGKVEFRFEISEGIAGLWAAAAWAEGHEHLAEWVYGLVNGWICDLALVTDRARQDGEVSRRDVVERLQDLGEKAQKRGERSLAVVLHATALAIVNGLETEVAERTVSVVSERALEHMEAHVRDVG
jgi:hypothetical protein